MDPVSLGERVGVLEAHHATTLEAMKRLADKTESLDAKIDSKFDKLTNRLPVWATMLIASLTLAVGALANAALR